MFSMRNIRIFSELCLPLTSNFFHSKSAVFAHLHIHSCFNINALHGNSFGKPSGIYEKADLVLIHQNNQIIKAVFPMVVEYSWLNIPIFWQNSFLDAWKDSP